MKHVIFILFCCFLSFFARSQDSTFKKGVEALAEKNFETAHNLFTQDIAAAPSFSSFYNLGVAASKQKNWNEARWAFESALKYKPLNGNAQFNAEFSAHQLNKNVTWTHPYSWLERIIFGFGETVWVIISIVSAIALGILLFIGIGKSTSATQRRWGLRLFIPTALLLFIGMYSIQSINSHFKTSKYALQQPEKVNTYLSPNGVQADQIVEGYQRLSIIAYSKDSSFIRVKTLAGSPSWIESGDVLTY